MSFDVSSSAQRGPDLLGGPTPAGRMGRLSLSAVLPAVVGVAGVSVAAAGLAVLAFLSGSGSQPEDVVPAGALGLVKVDLDPAANQKVAVYQLAEKFPASADKVDDEDNVKDQLLAAAFRDAEGIDYAADIQPWIGDRAAVAALPSGEPEPDALIVVAYRDRKAAEAGLARIRTADESVFYAFSNRADYVLLGETQATVDSAAATAEVLADADSFDEAVNELDGDQIVTAWLDLGAIWATLPPEDRQAASETSGAKGDLAPRGRVVLGVRADERFIEVQGRAVDVQADVLTGVQVGTEPGGELLRDLPASTVVAASVTGLGDNAVALYEQTAGAGLLDPAGLQESAQRAGLRLPEDLRVLLGQETLLAVFGREDVALRTRNTGSDGDFAVARKLADLLAGDGADGGPPVVLRDLENGVAVGSNQGALDQVSATDGGLGQSARFERAVPDADDAGLVFYLDVVRVLELGVGEDSFDRQDVQPLEAVGMTANGGNDGDFRLRITVR